MAPFNVELVHMDPDGSNRGSKITARQQRHHTVIKGGAIAARHEFQQHRLSAARRKAADDVQHFHPLSAATGSRCLLTLAIACRYTKPMVKNGNVYLKMKGSLYSATNIDN